MARLCHPNTAPPDGFIYVEPSTGVHFKGDHLRQLIERVVAHREWKNIQPTDFESVKKIIEDQICQAMPPGICAGEPGENYVPFDDKMRSISMDALMEFSMASFRFIESGGEIVSKAESARRAAICRGCRFNRPSPCVVCTPVFKAMDAFIPDDRKEPGLSACGICGCSLRAKILLPLDTLRAADDQKPLRFPSFCWLNDHGQTQKGSAQGEVPAGVGGG